MKLNYIHQALLKEKKEDLVEFYQILYEVIVAYLHSADIVEKMTAIYALYAIYYTALENRGKIDIDQDSYEVIQETFNWAQTAKLEDLAAIISKMTTDDIFYYSYKYGLKTTLLDSHGGSLRIKDKHQVYDDFIREIDYKPKSLQSNLPLHESREALQSYFKSKKDLIDLLKSEPSESKTFYDPKTGKVGIECEVLLSKSEPIVLDRLKYKIDFSQNSYL